MEQAIREIKMIKPTKGRGDTDKIRVAAYCRVSSDGDDQLNSFYAQMKYYTDYIRRAPNMELVDIYADEGITGTEIKKRPEFQRMLRDCQNRKLDRVLVKSVTRFSRNSLECIEAVRQMSECGVSVFFENDNLDTATMNSEMMLYIKSAFAQGEALSASKRMTTSVRMRMENGTYVTAVPPYGYRFENRQYVIVPEEAETVRTIYALYLSGVGCHAIATRLNAEQAGGRVDWNPELIKYILLNERYIGDALMQKRFTPSVLPLRSQRNRGEMPKYYYRDSHDAIISRADYEAVQALWKKRQEKYAKGGQMKTDCWLRKKLICRYCGRSYRLVVRSAPPRWVCSEKSVGGRQCPCRSYLTDEVGAAFVCLYNRLRQNTDVILDDTLNQLERLQTRVHAGNPELQALDGDALVLADQICRYSGLHAKGILDEVTYREQTDRLERKLSALRVRRSKLIGEDAQEKCVEELRSLKRMLSAMLDSMQIFDRSAFDRLITKIYAEPDGALTFALPGGLQLRLEESEWRSE